MCKKLIICMGNSYKNGGRCLAGIEVNKSCGGYNIVKEASEVTLVSIVRILFQNLKQGIL